MNLTSIPAHHADVASAIADDEAVLILPSKGRVQVLNAVGTRVWQLIDARRSVAEIVDQICREYEVEPEQAARDTTGFLADLLAKGLVTARSRGEADAGAGTTAGAEP